MKIEVGDRYRHFKGMIVEIICLAKDSETLEEMVVYRHVATSDNWVRSKKMFLSKVDREKYPGVKQEYRFERLEDGTGI